MQETRDVVVVGAGLAGYAAAITAAEGGADVLLLEKTSDPGGSSLMSGGSFAFAGTRLQRENGVEDGSELLYRDLMESSGYDDDTLIRVFVDNQLATFEWMEDQGLTFSNLSHSGGQSAPRSHGLDIKTAFARIQARAEELGNLVVRSSSGARVVNARAGRVPGVSFAADAQVADDPEISAPAVVLATGGFSRSERLIRTFTPRLLRARRMGGGGNTGDGILMGMALGADLSDIGDVKATFGVSAELDSMPAAATLLNSLYRGGILLNSDARRFVDESISYKLISDFCLQQPKGLGLQIFDQKVMDQTIPGKLVNDYAAAREAGYLIEAASLGELATKVGIDPGALEKAVEDYNRGVREGSDPDFGRSSLSAGYGERTQIDTAPYFAYWSVAGVTSTYGGLKVDADMRVQHVLDTGIEGLYAAGEIVGGFHGNSYVSGSSLSKSVIFGRIAGRNAATAALESRAISGTLSHSFRPIRRARKLEHS
jgi:fumarate reductase flavoprotein subunit